MYFIRVFALDIHSSFSTVHMSGPFRSIVQYLHNYVKYTLDFTVACVVTCFDRTYSLRTYDSAHYKVCTVS